MENIKKVMDSFFNYEGNGFREYFYTRVKDNLNNREDYANTRKKISETKNEFPKVQDYSENKTILDMTDDEKDAVLRIISLEDDLRIIEEMEAFKLGFREAYIFFKEQGMLNI